MPSCPPPPCLQQPCGISCRQNSNSEVTLYCNVFSTIYANNIGFQCQCHKKVRIRIPLKCTPQLAVCHLLIVVTYVQYQNSIVISYPCTMRFHEIFLQFSYFRTIYKYLPKTLMHIHCIIYNGILRIERNFLETKENIKIESHPFYYIICD